MYFRFGFIFLPRVVGHDDTVTSSGNVSLSRRTTFLCPFLSCFVAGRWCFGFCDRAMETREAGPRDGAAHVQKSKVMVFSIQLSVFFFAILTLTGIYRWSNTYHFCDYAVSNYGKNFTLG
jgi:hypothetical protein